MPKLPSPEEATVAAALGEVEAAGAALDALRERRASAERAAIEARQACDAAEDARAAAIREAIAAGTDPAAAARASQSERLRLAAEADDLAAVRAAIDNGIPDAEWRLKTAGDALEEARTALAMAVLPEQIAAARKVFPAVLEAWRTHCSIAGLPLREPAAFFRFVQGHLIPGDIEAAPAK